MKLKKRHTTLDSVIDKSSLDSVTKKEIDIHEYIYKDIHERLYGKYTGKMITQSKFRITLEDEFKLLAQKNITPEQINLIGSVLYEKYAEDFNDQSSYLSHGVALHIQTLLRNAVMAGFTDFSFSKEFPDLYINIPTVLFNTNVENSGFSFTIFNEDVRIKGVNHTTINYLAPITVFDMCQCNKTTFKLSEPATSNAWANPSGKDNTMVVTDEETYSRFLQTFERNGKHTLILMDGEKEVERYPRNYKTGGWTI